jgi:hypothetical protein
MGLSKIQNLEHKYKSIRTQFPKKKKDEAQSSIKRKPISTKDISNQT